MEHGGAALDEPPLHGVRRARRLVEDARGGGEAPATLERDWLGRIEHRAETLAGGSVDCTYGYDDDGRLETADCGAGVVSYGYDANGNRLTRSSPAELETSAYDAQDRLLLTTLPNGDSIDWDYSADGWVSQRTWSDGAGNVVTNDTFTYDAEGRLRSVTVAGQTVTYGYDPLGRRVTRTVGLVGGVTHRWAYGPTGGSPLAAVDAAGAVLTAFTYRGGGGLPALGTHEGVTYEVLSDHLGSYRGLVEVITGAVSGVVSYDEYGRVTAGEIPAWMPFGWAGGLWDPMTELVRFGA